MSDLKQRGDMRDKWIIDEAQREELRGARLERLKKMRRYPEEQREDIQKPKHSGDLNYAEYKRTKGFFGRVRLIMQELLDERIDLLQNTLLYEEFTDFTDKELPRGTIIDDNAVKLVNDVIDEMISQLQTEQSKAATEGN